MHEDRNDQGARLVEEAVVACEVALATAGQWVAGRVVVGWTTCKEDTLTAGRRLEVVGTFRQVLQKRQHLCAAVACMGTDSSIVPCKADQVEAHCRSDKRRGPYNQEEAKVERRTGSVHTAEWQPGHTERDR